MLTHRLLKKDISFTENYHYLPITILLGAAVFAQLPCFYVCILGYCLVCKQEGPVVQV